MSNLMREEFEAWQAKETPGADLYHCGELVGSGPSRVSYRNMYVAERWIGWQASRESLVIELPNRFDEKYQDYYDDVDGGCFNEARYIKDVHAAIHAAGVKTK